MAQSLESESEFEGEELDLPADPGENDLNNCESDWMFRYCDPNVTNLFIT